MRILKWFLAILAVLVVVVGGIGWYVLFFDDFMHTREGRAQLARLAGETGPGMNGGWLVAKVDAASHLMMWRRGDQGNVPRPKGAGIEENVSGCGFGGIFDKKFLDQSAGARQAAGTLGEALGLGPAAGGGPDIDLTKAPALCYEVIGPMKPLEDFPGGVPIPLVREDEVLLGVLVEKGFVTKAWSFRNDGTVLAQK